MEVVKIVLMAIATLSGIALIAAVAMQTSKADSFSAAMGGSADSSKFRKGSREEMLDRLTKAAAIAWISAAALTYIISTFAKTK